MGVSGSPETVSLLQPPTMDTTAFFVQASSTLLSKRYEI
jgi:hypothetical protein